MSDQSTQKPNSSNKYGTDWVPSPDDPNYEAYLKYQQNLDAATQGHPVTEHKSVSSENQEVQAAKPNTANNQPGTQSGNQNNNSEWERPKQENPDAEASDHIGPFYKPSHWSDKPNPDAPWWANPYTYVNKGEWREPNWGNNQNPQASDESPTKPVDQSSTPVDLDENTVADRFAAAQEDKAKAAGTEAKQADANQSAGQAETSQVDPQQNQFAGQLGAWIPTGNPASPWNWDAQAQPNQLIDGKPCKVTAGAWVPSGNPANPWVWNNEVLPNEYREGKPVFMPAQANWQGGQASTAGQQTGNPAAGSAGQPFGGIRDLSKESGEGRPDVPMGTRVGWFFIGLIGGFIGLLFAWMVASRYPQKQRKQVVWACWAGFFAWCLLMFVIMGMNATGTNPFAGGIDTSGSSSSSSAF